MSANQKALRAIRQARSHLLKANSWLGEAQTQERWASTHIQGLRALRDLVTSLDNMAGIVEFHAKHPEPTSAPKP